MALRLMNHQNRVTRAKTWLPKLAIYANPRVVLRWLNNWHSLPVLDWLQAAYYYRQSDFRSALECYQSGLKKYPEHKAAFSARLDVAYCLIKIGRLEEAHLELDGLVAEEGAGKEAVILLLRVLRYLGDKISSVDVARDAFRYFSDDPDVVAAAAHACVWASDASEEMSELRRSLFVARAQVKLGSREDFVLQTAMAHFETKFSQSSNAEQALARVLASGLAPYEAILLKGTLFLEQGRHLQARHQFLRAVRSRTEDPQPWTGIARSYLASNAEDELQYAYQAAEKACRLSNYRDCSALRSLVMACRALDKDSDAELYQAQIYELELAEELSPASIKELERQIERLQLLG